MKTKELFSYALSGWLTIPRSYYPDHHCALSLGGFLPLTAGYKRSLGYSYLALDHTLMSCGNT